MHSQVPATINRYLRDYQREGVRFLYQHFIKNEGAILGDDMGLGKTVQVRIIIKGRECSSYTSIFQE